MGQKSKRKKFKQDEDEPVFESDEYFAYIVGYTDGGFPYGTTWEDAREIAKREPQFGKDLGLTDSEENKDNAEIDLPF